MGWTLHSIACHILSLGIVGNDLGISLAHFIIIIARANVNQSSQDGSKHKELLANELTVKAEPVKQLYCPQPVMPYSVPVWQDQGVLMNVLTWQNSIAMDAIQNNQYFLVKIYSRRTEK